MQFFTNVTHELMTPLTIILTSLQNLNNGTGDNQTLYGVMSANATRLMRLIQQILEFRKVESGNLKIRVSHGDVVGFVRRCVEAFAPLVARKQLKVYFRASSEQVDGWFDPDKLDKIVYNLLSNAAKYTPDKGEIIIRIETGDDCSVCISVANSGELMTQQTIDGLFAGFTTAITGNTIRLEPVSVCRWSRISPTSTEVQSGCRATSRTATVSESRYP